MCGRFVQKTPLGAIQVLFETVNPMPNAPARYNAAPTDTLAVVRYNPKTSQRSLDLLRWGLVPLCKPVPYVVVPRQGMFAFAGLWERWRNQADGSILRSFTIVTGPANSLCRPIHERMPVILPPEAWPLWLGETETTPDQLLALLQACPEEWLRVYPVGPAVGNVRHDEPGLLDPAGADLRAGDLLPV